VNNLNRLYDEVIKRHNSQPYHFEKIENSQFSLRAYNPICGDRFDLFVELNDTTIYKIHFYGFGCAVSKASTSVMLKAIEGKSVDAARGICAQFLGMLKNELPENEILASEEFKSFVVVREIQSRYDCAALAWTEMEKYLSQTFYS